MKRREEKRREENKVELARYLNTDSYSLCSIITSITFTFTFIHD